MNRAALSPYHLTTREVPAMAALLLAGRVCTLLPAPIAGESREALSEAIDHSPRYRRLLNNWLALAPLFDAGVIITLDDSKDPADYARLTASRIDAEDAWDPLRPFARSGLFTDSDQYLDALAADLLKGGPDPGISLPINAGLDAFAAEHGLPVFRSGHAATAERSGSLAQLVEARLGDPICSVGLPILKQAGAKALLHARRTLERPLIELRGSVEAAILAPNASSGASVRKAGAAYTAAFKAALGDRLHRDDEAGRRLVPAFVSLSVRRMTADAVLVSSVAALHRASGAAHRQQGQDRLQTDVQSLVTITATPLDVEPL